MKHYKNILEQRLAQQLGLTWNNDTQLWDCRDNVNLSRNNLKRMPLKFGLIENNFFCENNELTSLEGGPTKVYGSFYCSYNNLSNLTGSPIVYGNFYCNNNQLTNLNGSPEIIGGDFYCSHNQLTSLDGGPQSVNRFWCHSNLVKLEKPEWLKCKLFKN
jgi:hypothetical protein